MSQKQIPISRRKILLIISRYSGEELAPRLLKLLEPLGLEYLASILQLHNFEVNIIDAEAERLSLQHLAIRVEEYHPDIVGLYWTTPVSKNVVESLAVIREAVPNAKIVVGGPHPTLMPKEVFSVASPNVDYILRGEAEYSFPILANAITTNASLSVIQKIPGICFNNEKEGCFISQSIPRTSDLDNIPFPARNLVHREKYFETYWPKPIASIITSRGCTFRCSFCAEPTLRGGRYDERSPENVVKEIKDLVSNHGIRYIVIWDETFNTTIQRAKEIGRGIIKEGIQVLWRTRCRVDKVDREMLQILAKSGCQTIGYGIETISPRLLKEMRKGITIDQIKRAITMTLEENIRVGVYIVMGMPSDTEEDINATIEFVKSLGVDYMLASIIKPLPKTKLWNKLMNGEDYGTGYRWTSASKDWHNYALNLGVAITETDIISKEDLELLYKKAYIRFYDESWLKRRVSKSASEEEKQDAYTAYEKFQRWKEEIRDRKKTS
jgi:radical SAM superfamily enzyme YgiQ (UPF0313 family)